MKSFISCLGQDISVDVDDDEANTSFKRMISVFWDCHKNCGPHYHTKELLRHRIK
jgi:hypothetical protein